MVNFGTPRAQMRAYFSAYHLWAAKDFASKSHVIESAYTGPSSFDMEHRALVIASIVEAVAFLESVINELYVDCFDGHPSYIEALSTPVIAALRAQWTDWHTNGRATKPTLEKFDAALSCAGINPFNHGTSPYQSAYDVLRLRNALVHYIPESVPSDKPHQFNALRSRFPENALMSNAGNAYFPDKCLGAGCANWCVTVVLAFADNFFAQLNLRPNYQVTNFSAT
jgi:hypothetical protein